MQFRWDTWVQGALASGLLAAIAIAPGIIKDGITGPEAWTVFSVFVGGVAFYCKDHPPKLGDQ